MFNAVLDDLLLSSFQRNSNQDIGCFSPALFTFINVCKVLANTCYLLFKRDYTRLYLTQNDFHYNTSKISVRVNVIIYLNYEMGIHKSHCFKMFLYIFLNTSYLYATTLKPWKEALYTKVLNDCYFLPNGSTENKLEKEA